ncbi:erythromycin esterase family protein [Streptomyces sp. NPDC012794]|uniref:erythromycin esterase family protein n=1 Tax=Streptomyces sp. NPDC012794 TaxID=3364850 RepID=UPI0036C993F8
MLPADRKPVSGEVTGWLARNAIRLISLTAGTSTSDLQPLKGVLDGVRVMGIGESTHGTREFCRLEHRLLKFLVTELGFSVLAMEASASAAPAVDAHVLHGVGDGAEAVAELGFWTWRTYEVLAVIEWMRAYDRGHPKPRRCASWALIPNSAGLPHGARRCAAARGTRSCA